MSHFAVLVIGDKVAEQLALYDESLEIAFDDIEEEYLLKYEKDSTTKVKMSDGRLLDTWDEEFRCSGSIGLGTDTHKVPETLEKVEVPYKTLFPTFSEFMKEWCGYTKDPIVGKYGSWHNPNAKWDWYVVGGRWSGFFKLKDKKPEELVGLQDLVEPAEDWVDQAKIGQIDFEGMVRHTKKEAQERYERLERLMGGSIPKLTQTWKDMENYLNLSIEEKREVYWNQPALVLKKEIADNLPPEDRNFISWISLEDFQISKEEYIAQQGKKAFITFAVVKEGKWYERGKMGWWGTVSNEKEEDSWSSEFNNLIESLPPDTQLTLVDCHI